MVDISVVIPTYNEQDSIEKLHKKLSAVLAKITDDYEIVFIDDGSTDGTLKKMKKLKKKDGHVVVIVFKRNFGKAAGLMAGFDAVRGDIVFTMDADLQDDPKEIPRFLKKLDKGYDLVSGWKFKRHDPVHKTLPSKFFNGLTRVLTGVKIHDNNCGYKAYRKKVVKKIRIHKGGHRFIPPLAQAKGFKVGEIKVTHHPRTTGKSKYGWTRLFKGGMDLLKVKLIIMGLKKEPKKGEKLYVMKKVE
jgi:glycosyltransferase involved in cell wall biosynthesis